MVYVKALMKSRTLSVLIGALLLLLFSGNAVAQTPTPTDALQELGKRLLFDNISSPPRMSCATCHVPSTGWTGGDSGVNQHQVAITGANPHEVGNLKPPFNAYSTFVPPFAHVPLFGPPGGPNCDADAIPVNCLGGVFWNGRAEGKDPEGQGVISEHVGEDVFDTTEQTEAFKQFIGPTTDQALNPFGPVEQNIVRQGVCNQVKQAKYAELFQFAWGTPIDCQDEAHSNRSFKRLALALGAWQASDEVNSFSSKRDLALANDADGKFPLDDLTGQENLGHDLFYGKAGCTICHNNHSFGSDGTESDQLYTDFRYHNIGVPQNPEIPDSEVPQGLADHTGVPGHSGHWKTPTLRNVDKRKGNGFTKAYTHNGWFKSLESIVHFYNTATLLAECPTHVSTEKEALAQNCWPAPQDPNATARGLLFGNLNLTPEEEAAVVAYLKTFTDTETPKQPRLYETVK
jgi:cytochrome c peroxidase